MGQGNRLLVLSEPPGPFLVCYEQMVLISCSCVRRCFTVASGRGGLISHFFYVRYNYIGTSSGLQPWGQVSPDKSERSGDE